MHGHGIDDGELRRRYAQVFDDIPEDYDRERRGYPDELIDAACERGGLRPGDAVLEVGSGTGLLTASLLARGLHVDAVDPGANMIRLARRRVREGAGVRFHHGRFEDVALPAGTCAAVFSASAFHWIEPKVGWARAPRRLACSMTFGSRPCGWRVSKPAMSGTHTCGRRRCTGVSSPTSGRRSRPRTGPLRSGPAEWSVPASWPCS